MLICRYEQQHLSLVLHSLLFLLAAAILEVGPKSCDSTKTLRKTLLNQQFFLFISRIHLNAFESECFDEHASKSAFSSPGKSAIINHIPV